MWEGKVHTQFNILISTCFVCIHRKDRNVSILRYSPLIVGSEVCIPQANLLDARTQRRIIIGAYTSGVAITE